MEDPQLKALLEEHNQYFSLTKEGKVYCTLNGHCFPPRYDVVNAFINGSKYTKLRQKQETEQGLTRFEPFLIQSKNFEDKLYCALTVQLINKRLDSVKQHMHGKKFTRAKEAFESGQQELLEEPSLESEPSGEGAGSGGDGEGGSGMLEDAVNEAEGMCMGSDEEAGPSGAATEEMDMPKAANGHARKQKAEQPATLQQPLQQIGSGKQLVEQTSKSKKRNATRPSRPKRIRQQ